MSVSVVIPWRGGCLHRERALSWTVDRYQTAFPGVEIVFGVCSPIAAFNRSEAILDGVRQATGDVLVVADGDAWTDGIHQAITEVSTWAVPHRFVHRLSAESTGRVLAGADWRGLPLSGDNPQDRRPYRGNETGTIVVVRRDVLAEAPPDPRFVGWGSEDMAWAAALHVLVGKPWRGTADLVHLWHPPQERRTRSVGNGENLALLRRYRSARKPAAMRALIDEGRVNV